MSFLLGLWLGLSLGFLAGVFWRRRRCAPSQVARMDRSEREADRRNYMP